MHNLEKLVNASHALVTVYIVGARAESTMPHELWGILRESFPHTSFEIHLVGPQVNAAAHRALARSRESCHEISIRAWKMNFEEFRETNANTSKPDFVVLFNPGLGHHTQGKDWETGFTSIFQLGAPILVTSFDSMDHHGDIGFIEGYLEKHGYAAEWLYKCVSNPFRCLKHEIHNQDHQRVINANAFASLFQKTQE